MKAFATFGKAPRGPAMAAVGWREKWPPVSMITDKTLMKMREEVTYDLIVT